MKKSLYFLALSALIFSACNTLEIDKNSTSAVKIGKVSVASTATKAGNDEVNTVYSSDEITIEEVSTPLASSAGTKATEKGKDNLSQFNILGYYDASIHSTVAGARTPLNFMKAEAEKKDGVWSLSNYDGLWAHDTMHHFWAYSGDAQDLDVEDGFTSASFSYSTDGSEDLLVAYTSQTWNGPDTHSDACGDNDEIKELQFHHALAKITANDNLKYYVREADGNKPAPSRGSITAVRIEDVITSGNCSTMYSNELLSFDWDLDSKSSNVDLLNTSFVIPQTLSSARVVMTVKDIIRGISIDTPAFLTTNWKSGECYTYNLSGNAYFPYVSDPDVSGIKLDVSGKEYKEALVGDIQAKYISKLTVSWKGAPATNGNKTYLYLFFGKEGVYSQKNLPDTNNEMVCFCYDAFNNIAIKPEGASFKTIDGEETMTCVIDVPYSDVPLSLYAAFVGGTGNQQQVSIHLKDFTCQIKDFR